MEEHHAHPWRTVENLIEIGYQRSRVVMMNECYTNWFRCIRTRQIGQRILPTAHQLGVRHLAMEALYPSVVEEANLTRSLPADAWGYLQQPEMQYLHPNWTAPGARGSLHSELGRVIKTIFL